MCQVRSNELSINCWKVVFDHIKEYKLDIVALTEMWLSSEDSKSKHVIDQCVAHGYTLTVVYPLP